MSRRRELLDELALREASLRDAHREHAAGDLSDQELADIVARDESALAELRASLDALIDDVVPAPAPGPTRRRRRSLLVVALVAFALAIVVVLANSFAPRRAGQSATGSVSVNAAQAAQQWNSLAESAVASGSPFEAVQDYRHALDSDPTNYEALTQFGWLTFSAGSTAHNRADIATGLTFLRRAISVNPQQSTAYMYYAIAAAVTPGNEALARRTFSTFLSLHPSTQERATAQPWLRSVGLTK